MSKKSILAIVAICIAAGIAGISYFLLNDRNVKEEQEAEFTDTPSVFHELNDYQTYSASAVMGDAKAYGFSKGLTEEPSAIKYGVYMLTPDMFSTQEMLWSTLESMNTSFPLKDMGGVIYTPKFNTGDTLRTQAELSLREVGDYYDFNFASSFSPELEEDDYCLTIRVYANEEAGHVSDAEAIIKYAENSDKEQTVLIFDDKQLNLFLDSTELQGTMTLGHYEVEESSVSNTEAEIIPADEILTEQSNGTPFEAPITEGILFLDEDIEPKPDMIDDSTYTGVIAIESEGQYIKYEDLWDAKTVIDSAFRLVRLMRSEWSIDGVVFEPIDTNVTPEIIQQEVEAGNTIQIRMSELEGGNVRLSWSISPDTALISAYPTGSDTVPNTRVYYDTDYSSPWIPYKFTHVMGVNFSEVEIPESEAINE